MSDNVKEVKQVKRDVTGETNRGESSGTQNREEKDKPGTNQQGANQQGANRQAPNRQAPNRQAPNRPAPIRQAPVRQAPNTPGTNNVEANKQDTRGELKKVESENAELSKVDSIRYLPNKVDSIKSIASKSDTKIQEAEIQEAKPEEVKQKKGKKKESKKQAAKNEEAKREASKQGKEREEKSRDENYDNDDDDEDKQYEHYAVIPPNGGWGWMVVATAFYCNVVTDGIQFTYGVFMESISHSLNAEYSKVALAGSMMFGVHLLMGPLCSGVTSAFGLRLVTVLGALICSVGVALAYFATNFWLLCLTYGLIGGIGLGLVYMNSLVITGLYFTTLMPIAIGIVVCGTGVGTMIFAFLGHFLLNITTWQNTMLINSALSASMALAALAFKPLKPIGVKLSKSNANFPSLRKKSSDSSSKMKSVFIKKEVPVRLSITSTRTIQSYIWNAVLQDTVLKDLERSHRSKCWKNICKCCKCCKRKRKRKDTDVLVLSEIKHDIVLSEIDRRRSYVEKPDSDTISQASSVVPSMYQEKKPKTQAVYERVEYKKRSTKNLILNLKKSLVATIDCHLLASCSFFLFTLSGALQMAALLVVYIYEKDRCKDLGFTEEMSVYFVITLGGANTFWRLFLGCIAIIPRVNSHLVAVLGITVGGVATLCSGLSNNIYYQFAFCFFYSLGMASFAVFRLVLLLEIVKPEETANATGINLLFMGFFCIIAPPLCGWAMELTRSYDVIFLTSGIIIIASAILLIGVKKLRKKELEKLNENL